MGRTDEILNEVGHREANDRAAARERGPWLVEFDCECFAVGCGTNVQVTKEELERVHAHPSRFVVFPGHVDPAIEKVVETHQRYWVVEKPTAEVVDLEQRRRRLLRRRR